jgi:capsular exopolysaccharide synthesis family protein
MDFSRIPNIIYRYLWVVLLTTLVASVTTYFMISNEPVSYKATTQLLVGASLDSPSPDLESLRIGGQLISTYAELVQTRPFLESVNNKLEQKEDLTALGRSLSVRQSTETRVLTINVFHSDPKQAVAVANAVAQTFVDLSPSGKDNTTELLRAQMNVQAQQLEEIVTKAEAAIQQLETELAELRSARTVTAEAIALNLERQNLIIQQLSDERGRLTEALRTLATIYGVLLDTNTNQVQIIEPARTVVPVDQNLLLRVATAGLGGLVFALLIIFAAEYLDDRIRYQEDLSKIAGVPILSTIEKHPRLAGSGPKQFVTFAEPKSHVANSYREVVAKLLFQIGESMPSALLVTSVGLESGEDTADTAANLAVAFAQAGHKVVLIDAQLHNPTLTRMFRADTREGLADYLVASHSKTQLVSVDEVPGFRLLPAGSSPERGSGGMLNAVKMAELVETAQKEADIVLIAGSPISWFAETLTLASQVNATILVVRYGEAHGKIVSRVIGNLRAMNVRIAGLIFDYNPSASVPRPRAKAGTPATPVAPQASVSEQTSKS